MKCFGLAIPALFAVSVHCLSVISPGGGSQLDVSRETTITWSFDSSDPDTFDLYIVNDERVPSVNVGIGSDLNTTHGSYTFNGVDVVPGSGYVFDLKDVSTSDILAQSEQFIVVSKGSDTYTASASTTSTAQGSTGTSTSTESESETQTEDSATESTYTSSWLTTTTYCPSSTSASDSTSTSASTGSTTSSSTVSSSSRVSSSSPTSSVAYTGGAASGTTTEPALRALMMFLFATLI